NGPGAAGRRGRARAWRRRGRPAPQLAARHHRRAARDRGRPARRRREPGTAGRGGSMSGRRVLAVDGGNSKTDVAILDETGRVLGTHRGPGASFTPDDHDWSVAALDGSVRAAAKDARVDGFPLADAGVFCLAGADLPADDRRILRWLRSLGLVVGLVLRYDSFAVMRAG